jgi:FAD/FMN-containing dehydrogenase
VLALLLVGHLAAAALGLVARLRPRWRGRHFDTLRPRSLGELLALYNPYNYRHVKVVGYNNGVVHFGHRFPGRTVVSTVNCDRVVRTADDEIKVDCGVTIRKARDFLADSGQDLPVVPNYSYVCLGTAFFVPIHGSASDCSCVAGTITRAVLYLPGEDRLVSAGRDDPAFRDHLFNQSSDALVLRLCLRVKPRASYYLDTQELTDPGADALVAALRDERAANVEVRKPRAAGDVVRICRFYTDAGAPSPALEVPRDSLGRLWDRLEENPVTSFLFHALTRCLAWHVELFFTAEEFARFWQGHRALPLRKIQLRYLRRDGFPHSPCRDHDCVSVDLFLLRRHRRTFEDYLKATFAVVRFNPGKHSR